MNSLTIEDLMEIVSGYCDDVSCMMIRRAYEYADYLHKGQKRQSGEEYIIHPLNVAYILAEMHADVNTVVAGLLHDTLEDTNVTKEDITAQFNKEVAYLVDGVTKLAKMNYSSKEEQNLANTRKIITSITGDVRIIIIKLCDRLHNMRTLQYKNHYKQVENSLETLEIFVPLAYYIGAYRIKNELEDLAFYYTKPDSYLRIKEKKSRLENDSNEILEEALYKIKTILNDREIPNDIKIRTKNIYGIYKQLNNVKQLCDIHDLFALKVMVEEIDDCYRALRYVHSIYHPINERFKDYICNPKTNMYSSLHTTVFGPNDRLIQTQIRTFEMDKIASFGLTTYWELNGSDARSIMQKDLKEKYQFFNSLIEIDNVFANNREFVDQVNKELFSDKIYVYLMDGSIIELPKGATVIDLAYKLGTDIGDTLASCIVNENTVTLDYKLKNKDRVKIITDILAFGNKKDWENKAITTKALTRIKELSN